LQKSYALLSLFNEGRIYTGQMLKSLFWHNYTAKNKDRDQVINSAQKITFFITLTSQ